MLARVRGRGVPGRVGYFKLPLETRKTVFLNMVTALSGRVGQEGQDVLKEFATGIVALNTTGTNEEKALKQEAHDAVIAKLDGMDKGVKDAAVAISQLSGEFYPAS